MEEPTLPEPTLWGFYEVRSGSVLTGKKPTQPGAASPVYSADQMQAYARAAVLAERERCARVCEAIYFDPNDNNGHDAYYTRPYLECADAIRKGE